jgi:starvation-inducible DNA-binding protein
MAKAKTQAKPSTQEMDTGISAAERQKIATGLNALLADTYVLYLKTHAFHWNVVGPMFQTLHLMFETHYNELWTSTDVIAERIRALGLPVMATWSEFAQRSSIDEAKGVPQALDMVRELVQGHEAAARTARAVFPKAEQGGDEATVDLLTQRLQVHEKTAWMLRSLLA